MLENRDTIDAAGQLVSPPFVDAHFHMDATLSYGLPRINQSGTLLEGIALWGELKPQLTLEAAILREGGFKDIAADFSVGELVYVRLSGNNPPGEQRSLELKIRNNDTPQRPDEADRGRRLAALLPERQHRLTGGRVRLAEGRLRQPRPFQTGVVGRLPRHRSAARSATIGRR